jgi:hypothetical protein
MHRSGTSALTGVLARMGCDLPKTEMPVNDSNAKGFYESHKAYLLNNSLLESAGSNWQDWQPLSQSWARSARAEEFAEAIAQVVAEEFGTSRLFALKDPRICRLLPYWEKALRDAGCDVVVVHTHRNPLEVAQSLQDRKKLPLTVGLMVWLRYVLDAEAASRDLRRSFTSYARLMRNWQPEIDRIESDLGIVLPRRSLQSAEEIEDFLTRDLKHFNQTPEDVTADTTVNDWVRTVYDILEAWADSGETTSDHETLDRINTLFSVSAANFGPILKRMQEDIPLAAAQQIEKLKEKVGQATRDSSAQADAKAEIERLTVHIDQITAAAKDATETQTRLADERARAIKAREALIAERNAQTEQISALETVLQDRSRDVARFESENAALGEQLKSRYQEIARLSLLTREVTQDRDTLKEELDQMRLDVGRNLKKQARQIGIQQSEIKATMDQLHEAKVARDYFQTTLAALQSSSSWRMMGPLRRLTRLFRR